MPHVKKSVSTSARSAAARAILRHGLHTTNHLAVERTGGLHPMYISLHGRGEMQGDELKELLELISDLQKDLLDAISALDRLDGGFSVLLRCPGSQVSADMGTEGVAVDLVVQPRELLAPEGGKELTKALALLVQAFGKDVALPYLTRFNQRCRVEGVTAPPVPDAGRPLKLSGSSHLPASEQPGGLLIHCQCRRGGAQELSKDIAIANISFPVPPARTIIVSDDDTRQNETITQSRKAQTVVRSRASGLAVDDGFSGAIISIGPRTDAVLDRFKLGAQEIPKLRVLSFNERSSKWEEAMRSPGDFSYSYEIASTMADAMRADLGVQARRKQVREVVP
ncbi:hypothetical protein DXG01_016788 [Tephrocybe rancida]|nr:hypothetical protein DXG01_016788 [Tephrocybe rancida]